MGRIIKRRVKEGRRKLERECRGTKRWVKENIYEDDVRGFIIECMTKSLGRLVGNGKLCMNVNRQLYNSY